MVKNILYFVILLFIQLFFLDRIMFLGFIVPYIYFYILLWLPLSISSIWLLLIAFGLGHGMDIIHLSVGLHAFACVNVALFRNTVYRMLVKAKKTINIEINIYNLGILKYLAYIAIMTSIHTFSIMILEWFSLNIFNYYFVIRFLSDILASMLLIILIDLILLRFRKLSHA